MVNDSLEALREEIRALTAQVEDHGYRYHVLDDPVITDSEYDELFRRLSRLEREHPELALPNSPTAKVGGPPVERFAAVRHTVPMLSLDNRTNPDELADFEQRIQRVPEDRQSPGIRGGAQDRRDRGGVGVRGRRSQGGLHPGRRHQRRRHHAEHSHHPLGLPVAPPGGKRRAASAGSARRGLLSDRRLSAPQPATGGSR